MLSSFGSEDFELSDGGCEMIRSPLFNDLFALRDSLEAFANQTFGSNGVRGLRNGTSDTSWAAPMPMDVYANNDEAVILAAVPGMTPDDVDLTVDDNTVTITGTVKRVEDSQDAKDATWYISELGSGTYRRSVTLPFPVDAGKAQATFEHGILRVVLPKTESAKPRKIAIGGSKDQAITAKAKAA
jgi:HSP20 family protein